MALCKVISAFRGPEGELVAPSDLPYEATEEQVERLVKAQCLVVLSAEEAKAMKKASKGKEQGEKLEGGNAGNSGLNPEDKKPEGEGSDKPKG